MAATPATLRLAAQRCGWLTASNGESESKRKKLALAPLDLTANAEDEKADGAQALASPASRPGTDRRAWLRLPWSHRKPPRLLQGDRRGAQSRAVHTTEQPWRARRHFCHRRGGHTRHRAGAAC